MASEVARQSWWAQADAVRQHLSSPAKCESGRGSSRMSDAWRVLPPGKPLNFSVTVWHTHATVEWKHALPSAGGLATHYSAKWQSKDGKDVHWYPDWLGVGAESLTLTSLAPGGSYALRVAAVNRQGHAWSDVTAFTTLPHMQCDGYWHWAQLYSSEEVARLCGGVVDDPSDPDPRACSVGSAEYALAGAAAGAMASLVAAAAIARAACARREARAAGRHVPLREEEGGGARHAKLRGAPRGEGGAGLGLRREESVELPRGAWGSRGRAPPAAADTLASPPAAPPPPPPPPCDAPPCDAPPCDAPPPVVASSSRTRALSPSPLAPHPLPQE
ncbi:hypothetical protein AB1Y20_016749 [Prymnesium parvum]|uniref:Fibronectin type-III domain-containing protein n=1 Tax=Prymnesium parvum TaxID=97485 RepID=A0AB34ICZ1_PRYPA